MRITDVDGLGYTSCHTMKTASIKECPCENSTKDFGSNFIWDIMLALFLYLFIYFLLNEI